MSSFEEYRKKLSGKYGTKPQKEEEKQEEKKAKVDGSSVWDDSFESFRKKMNTRYGADIDLAGVKSWFTEGESTIKGLGDYYKTNEGKWVSNYGADFTDSIANLKSKADAVGYYLRNHKTEFADYASLSKAFSEYRNYLNEAEKQNTSLRDFYSKFANEREYNVWYDGYKKEQEYLSVKDAEDFDEYSKLGAGVANPDWDSAQTPVNLFGWKPFGEGETVNNMITFAEANRENAGLDAVSGGIGSGPSSEYTNNILLINKHAKDDEKKIYNYYIGKGDKQKADEYLSYLLDVCTQREAGEMVKAVDEKFLLEGVFSLAAGVEQALYGLGNIDNLITGTKADPTTLAQYAYGITSSNNEGLRKVGNDLAHTTGNMLPAIGAGALTSAVAGPAAGKVVGSFVTGLSSAGNSYAEMIEQGYGVDQARKYGVMVGAAEGGLSYLFSGISKMGGKVTGKVISKAIDGIDSGFARFFVDFAISSSSEAIEEGAQSILDPVFKMIATGEDFEGIDWSEVGYSAMLGALSAGLLEGAPNAASAIHTNYKTNVANGGLSIRDGAKALFKGDFKNAYNTGKQNVTESAGYYVNEALEIDPDNAHAQRMQARINEGKNVSGYQINRLVEANENALVSQDKGKIKAAAEAQLTKLGETGDISKIAEAIAKYHSGEKLTRGEKALISNSKYGRRVSNGLNPDNIMSGEYDTAWAENIGTDRINADVYNRGAEASVGQTETASVTENTPVKGNATEAKFDASVTMKNAEGKTANTEIQSVEVDGDKASFTLSTGEKVERDNVAFKSENAQMVADIAVENVSRVKGFSNEAATAMIKGYDGSISPSQYTMAFNDAFKMGASGIPSSKLIGVINSGVSERVAYTAYELGRQSAKKVESVLKSVSKNGIIESNETEAENESGENVHLRNGSKRDGGKNTQRQVSRMEGNTGQAESRGKTARIADSEAARLVNEGREVTVSDLGILGGSKEQTVRLVDKANETSSMKEARKRAEARGLKVTFFVGDNLVIKDKSGEWISARAYIKGNHVFVRADHSLYTADQLMRHELGHDMIAKGEVDIKAVRERLEETVGKEKIDEVAKHYADAYAGTGMSAEEIWEECICDSLGDMNIFATAKTIGSFLDKMLPEIKAAASESKSPTQTRGSPTSKSLYKGRDAKGGWGKVYGTAQEALNDATKSVDSKLWDAFEKEFNSGKSFTPITNAIIAVQEDVRQDTITPIQGAKLLSEVYQKGGAKALDSLYIHETGNLHPKALERAKQYSTSAGEVTEGKASREVKAKRLYVFPPYNESQSDANEIATRWAHREDVKTGYKRIVSYHGNFYLIEKFDSSDLGYQIVEQLTKKQYYEYIKEYGNGENIAEQSSKESSSTIDSLNTERDWVRRGEYSATSSPVGQRGENIQVQRVGENKIEGRQDTGNRDGGLRGSFSNKQKYSRELDTEYLSAVNRGDTEAAQKMVDEAAKKAGYTVKAYHGTSRGDRVGNVFLPERATSGPMAFFTDNKVIAEGYSKGKQDTSMAYDPDFDQYETQFRIKTKYNDMPLYRAWGYLPFDARNRITKKAGQLRENWDGDGELILDPTTNEAGGGFQWQLKEARGNAIQALTEQWLNSGNLFNEEARFLDVLKMAGVTEEFKKIGMDSLYFKDPHARHEKVYDTFLKINNPLDTSTVDEAFVSGLLSWYESQDQSQYERESVSADLWDKNSIDAYEFAERVRDDIERGTFHAWTSIPDSVTDYLKHLGYDGIQDVGGKNGGEGHTVWIPFSSEQVKSAEPVTYNDKGEVIPLSERFNSKKSDIRYSRELDTENMNSSDRNTASFNGKPFWSGSVSLLDGVIEEVHTMEEAEATDFHHSMYFSQAQVEKMENGENAFFWVDNGKVNGNWRESVPQDIIKKIEEQIVTNNTDIRYSRELDTGRVSYAPTFYSHMGKVIDDIKLEKMGTSSILNHLKNRGVKDEEIKWSGIEAFLEGKKSVTKAELQEFVAGSQLQIEEDMGTSGWNLKKDGENYIVRDRDGNILETWEPTQDPEDPDLVGWINLEAGDIASTVEEIREYTSDWYDDGGTRWSQYRLDGGTNYRELVFRMPNSTYSNNAMKAHWGSDAEGVLAHARIQDMTTSDGKRMLFIEEIQSDWHNAGQKHGYEGEGAEAEMKAKDYKTITTMLRMLRNGNMFTGLDSTIEEDIEALNVYAKAIKVADIDIERTHFGGDPNEPLVYVMWSNGDMVVVEENALDFRQEITDALAELRSSELSDYRNVEIAPDAPFKNNYHEYVLKRLLRMAAEEGYDSIGWTTADIQSERWSDKFAEGYRIEYDQDIPKFLRKYGKKWGATVGSATINGNTEVWSMDITDPMKESVLYEGQPSYSRELDLIDYINENTDGVERKSLTNREILANALETAAQNDIERNKLKQYKEKIDLINSEEQKLHDLREQIKELSFKKGPRDTQAIKNLQFEANQAANRINTYDKQLLNLESTKALKGVLEREKALARKRDAQKYKEALERYREKSAKTQRELMERYQESRRRGAENRNKTAMRHKIKEVVNDLNNYLLKGTKDKHVPIELQKAVAEALDAVNMDTVGAEERIAKKRAEMMSAKTPEVVEKLAKEIETIQQMGGNMAAKISRLKTSYDSIINSDDPLVAGSHDEVISNTIDHVMEFVGNTPLRDMSLPQLEAVYDMYRMVLHSIRNANKAFKAKKSEEISVIANRVMEEVDKLGNNKAFRTKLGQAISEFDWNNQKPIYAFERIGSNTFTEVFTNVRAGEDVWATDMTEAQEFREEQYKKHKYDSWDFKKRFGFTSTSGMHFELSLDQIMSLYAYSKREQAAEHLKRGGIVFDETTEVTVKNKLGIPVKFNPTEATAYNLSDETLADIISKLTPDQKAFVDAMQDYLSTTMGEKGNEVSLELYGVKLFKEKHYFPLRSATQFMAKAKEQQKGEVKIKNSGFSKETVYKANNPIVLTPFMDVWAGHVNEMSMYHAFVLALEDFYRVYNYKTPTSETMATESVEMYLQNAYGKGATKYIDQLLKDLNGGARVDSTVGIINKMTGLFKKSAVFASASVVIQQPSAIARATALVDTKYFVGKPSKHKETWAEVKKYAPVAVIKEMGYFDTGMGKSSVEWLKGEKTLKDKIDDFAAKAPALADEYAWCAIWNAVKRETLHNHKDLKPTSEEFLKLVGERFTEVVTKTQVYDSVLSRSANMRSKDTGMKMATAFMGEPTTSLNMLQDALIQGKRGNKRYAAKAIGGVVSSMILNSILVSIVYAGRDDDEDKTYAEKYISTLTEELLDSFNPLTLVPFVKDIVSIAQGYDVERSDMAVITDLINAWNNLDSDNRSVYRKVEDFGGAIASIFGLPVKNVMRDVRGMYNTIISFINGEKTTGAGIGNAIGEAVTGKEKSNGQQLYEAMIKGDAAQIERIRGRFEDQKAIDSAIRKALRENDPRIKEAAEARYNGDIAEYMKIAKEIIAEGNFKQDDVVAAINSEINALKKVDGETSTSTPSDKAVSLYSIGDYYSAIMNGASSTAYAVKEDLIQTEIANGKDRDEAEESFNSKLTSHVREQYEAGEINDYKAKEMLTYYAGKTEEEAASKIQYWKFKQQYPDYDLTESAVSKYYSDVEPSGISVDVYYDYTKQRAKAKGTDLNGDGKTDSGSVKVEVMQIINSLPISSYQKDALYFLNGWSKSTLWEAPWH